MFPLAHRTRVLRPLVQRQWPTVARLRRAQAPVPLAPARKRLWLLAFSPHMRGSQSREEPMFMNKRRATSWGLALALLGALSFLATMADARVGGGGSYGSRGSRDAPN